MTYSSLTFISLSKLSTNTKGRSGKSKPKSKRRQLLKPWLIDQINRGDIPGLVWIDHEDLLFKIPWRHFGRPGTVLPFTQLNF